MWSCAIGITGARARRAPPASRRIARAGLCAEWQRAPGCPSCRHGAAHRCAAAARVGRRHHAAASAAAGAGACAAAQRRARASGQSARVSGLLPARRALLARQLRRAATPDTPPALTRARCEGAGGQSHDAALRERRVAPARCAAAAALWEPRAPPPPRCAACTPGAAARTRGRAPRVVLVQRAAARHGHTRASPAALCRAVRPPSLAHAAAVPSARVRRVARVAARGSRPARPLTHPFRSPARFGTHTRCCGRSRGAARHTRPAERGRAPAAAGALGAAAHGCNCRQQTTPRRGARGRARACSVTQRG
jgi:hypothetical protein